MKNNFLPFLFAILPFFTIPLTSNAEDFLSQKTTAIGKSAPDFELSDTQGKTVKLSDYRGKIAVLHFWSAACPFVKRYEERLQKITSDYAGKGVAVLGIDSNDNETPAEVQKAAVEKWDGHMPQTMLGGTMPFIDVNSLVAGQK